MGGQFPDVIRNIPTFVRDDFRVIPNDGIPNVPDPNKTDGIFR